MKRNDIFIKTVALFTLIAFVTAPVTWAEPISESPIHKNQSISLLTEKLIIPDSLGTIQEQNTGSPGKPQIIFIQDAHAVIDAQQNISALIEYFETKHGIRLIALEGGQGKIDTTLFEAFPNRDITEKVMQGYLERAEINGAVLASVMNSNDAVYCGIEDWPLYEMNYVAYLRAMKRKDEILKELHQLRQKLDAKRREVYSPQMNLYHDKVQAFRDEQGKLMDLLTYVRNSGKGAWLKDVRAGKYPHLKVLLDSVGNDAKFAMDEASVQVSDLAKKIKKQFVSRLTKQEAMEFNGQLQDFSTGRMDAISFLKYLTAFAEKKGKNLQITPLLRQMLGYADTLSAIKGTKLFAELEDVLNDIEEGVITKKEEREISEQYKKMIILKNLASLELTREELRKYSKSPEMYQELMLNRGLLTPAMDFYRLALQRDSALHENLEKLMRERQVETAVVLAGGFHSEGFTATMKEREYSYVLVTPRIKSLAGHERYEKVMAGELSYKDYLKTTVYDAFARHATLKLVSEMNGPDFKKTLKLWRDETIRRLASEGRVGGAGRYTRYLDSLIRLYAEKFGPESLNLESKEAMIEAVERKLAEYQEDSLARLWEKFETKLSGFADAVQGLLDKNDISAKKLADLIREEGARPGALAASLGGVIPGLKPGVLEQVILGELDFSALDALQLPVSMSDIRDVLAKKQRLARSGDLSALPEIGRGVEALSRIAQEGLPSNPVSRQIAAKVVDEVIGAIRPKALEQASAKVDSEIAAALKEKLDAAAKAASLGEGQAEPMNPEWRSARIAAMLDSIRLEEFITDENIRGLSDPATEAAARERMLAVMLEKVDPVIDEIRNIYSEVVSASLKRAERYPDQARRDQWNLTGILARNEVNEKFLQPFIRKMENLLEAKGVRHPFFDEILQSMRRTDGVAFVPYTMGSSDLPLNLSLADTQVLNDQILAPLTYSRWDDSGIMRDHEAVFGAQAVDHLYEQMLTWSSASVSSKLAVAHRLIPAVAQVNERGRLEMARYLLLSWSHNLFSVYGIPDHETVDFAKTFSDANLARLAELEKSGNPAYPPGFSALLKGIRDNHQQYWFHPQFEPDTQKPVLDKVTAARADMRNLLLSYLDTPGFQALAVATLTRLADNPYAIDNNEILPRALAILTTPGGDADVKTATAVYLAKSMTKSLTPDIPKFLVEHFEEFPDFVKDEISRHAGEAYRNLVYQNRFEIDIDFAQKIAAVFNHQESRTAKLSALDILDTAGFMQMLEEKIYFRFNGEYVDWAFKFAKSPLFMRLITSFHDVDYRPENKHLPRWAALLERTDADALEERIKTIARYARTQGYGLSWGYFEGVPGEMETTAISVVRMDKVLESVPADPAAIQPGSEFAVVIDARLGLLPGGPSDYAAFAVELARFRDIMGASGDGFLHSSFEPLVKQLKARNSQLTVKGVADYLAAVNHIEEALLVPQPQATADDALTEDDIMIITEYLFTHAHGAANLTKLFDDFFNSEAPGPKRKLDYHFFVTFMKNLVNADETLVTPEADIFFKLFTSKKLHGFHEINKIVRRNANMLDAARNTQAVDFFRDAIRLLNRPRSDYLGKPWRLETVSKNKLDDKVDSEDRRVELSRVLAKEFSAILGLMIDLSAVEGTAAGGEDETLLKLREDVLNSMRRAAGADERTANRRYGEFRAAEKIFRETYAEKKAQVLFQLFRGLLPIAPDQAALDLADLRAYTEIAPKNQIGDTVIDSMVQLVQLNYTRPEVVAEGYRLIMAEARGEFADYRYKSPDYARMFTEWETSRKPEQDTEGLKRARKEEISRIQSNWQANQYYAAADELGKKLHLGFTDNFATLLNLGNPDYFGSCQATYKADYNRGVAGMLANGWNKALVIYDDNGRFLARRIVRLRLTDKGEFVLLREQTYGFNSYEKIFEEMLAKLADDMGIRYEPDAGETAEKVTLRLWKGNSEWEYSDQYGKQFLGENVGLIRMKEGEEFNPYLNITLTASSVAEMGQMTGQRYAAESEEEFKLIANREQTGTLIAVDFAAIASSSLAGAATAASLGSAKSGMEKRKKELRRVQAQEPAAELTIADLQAKARAARKSWASWLRFGAITVIGLIIAPGAMKLMLVMFLVYMPLHELAHYAVARYYFYKNYPAGAQDENIKKDAPVFEPIVRWAFGIFPHPAVIYEEKRYTSFQNALIIIMAPISELLLGFAAYAVISGFGTEGMLLDLVQVVAVAGLAAVPIRLFAEFFSKHSDVRKFIANLRHPHGLPDTRTPDIETTFVGQTVRLDMKHPEPGMGEPFTDKDKFPQQPSGQSLGAEPENLEIMELLPGSNTWRLRDIRPGGYDRYLKLDPMGREEELGFRYAKLLGANTPQWQRFKVSELDQLKFGDEAQSLWGGEWAEAVRKLKAHAAETGEENVVLAQDMAAMTEADLAVPDSSGFEEMLVFLAFTDARDVGWNANLGRREIGGKKRFFLFDMTSAAFTGTPLNDSFTYNDEMIGRMYEGLDAARMKAAIERVRAMSPDDLISQALEAGYPKQEIQREGFAERQKNLDRIVANALLASVKSRLIATGLPLFAGPYINYAHVNYLLDTPEYASDFWKDIMNDLFDADAPVFMALLDKSDDEIFAFARDQNPYLNLTLDAVARTVQVMLDSIPAYGKGALPGFKKEELAGFARADELGKEILRKVNHARDVVSRLRLAESSLYQKIKQTAEDISHGSVVGASLGESVPFNELIAALRNNIGRADSTFLNTMFQRLKSGEAPIRPGDPVGKLSTVDTLLPSFKDKHFSDPHEAVREIITNGYDAMKGIPEPSDRNVNVALGTEGEFGTMEVSDFGPGMKAETILTKFLPPFQGDKKSERLDSLKEILDREDLSGGEKIEQLRAQASQDITGFSAFEQAIYSDIRRKLQDYADMIQVSPDEAGTVEELLGSMRDILYSTGQFGIGFYSLLYFVRQEGDEVNVETRFGIGRDQEAYRVTFLIEEGKLKIRFDRLTPSAAQPGTTVKLKSRSFNKESARKVIDEFLSFDNNAKINVQMDDAAAVTVNREAFDRERFEHFEDAANGVEIYAAKDVRRTKGDPKTKVSINVHGVTIFTQELEGFGMPSQVVLNFPPNIRVPISRNRILADPLFVAKAQAMIALMEREKRLDLLSAFYPVADKLQYKRVQDAGTLKRRLRDAAREVRQWNDAWMPNSEKFLKLTPKEQLFWVDAGLIPESVNDYAAAFESVTEGGQIVMLGTKKLKLADFVDDTKFVTTADAVYVNRKFAPEIDIHRALFNPLLGLEKEPNFSYYEAEPAAVEAEPAGQPAAVVQAEPSPAQTAELEAMAEDVLSRVTRPEVRQFLEPILRYARKNSRLHEILWDSAHFADFAAKLVDSGVYQPSDDNLTEESSLEKWTGILRFFSQQIRNLNGRLFWDAVFEERNFPNLRGLTDAMSPGYRPYIFDRLLTSLRNAIQDKDKSGVEIVNTDKIHEWVARLRDLSESLDRTAYYVDEYFLAAAIANLNDTRFAAFTQRLVFFGAMLEEEEEWNKKKALAAFLELNRYWMDEGYFGWPLEIFLKGDTGVFERYSRIVAELIPDIQSQRSSTSEHPDEAPYLVSKGDFPALFAGILNSEPGDRQDFINLVFRENPDQSVLYNRHTDLDILKPYLYYLSASATARGEQNVADWQVQYDLLNSHTSMRNVRGLLASDLPLRDKVAFLKSMLEMISEGVIFPYEQDWQARAFFDYSLLRDMPVREWVYFIQLLAHFDSAAGKKFIDRKHQLKNPQAGPPTAEDYRVYREEISRKLIQIYKIASVSGEYDKLLGSAEQQKYGFDNWDISRFDARLAPYVSYLLSNEDATDLEDEITLDAQKARSFRLVDLYDTWSDVSDGKAETESDVLARVNTAAQFGKQTDTARQSRREFLGADFRSVSRQNMDLHVAAREMVQNVLDETPPGARGKLTVNTYRKDVAGKRLTVLDVQDEIGMDAERIFNKLLMPFSTTKLDQTKGYLGEQGQGFFTLLANSEYVVIESVRDGKGRKLKITPIRKFGDVIDYMVEDEQLDPKTAKKMKNGTRIQAFVNMGMPELESEMVKTVVRKYAGLVNLDRMEIKVNGEWVNNNRKNLLTTRDSPRGTLEFYSTPGTTDLGLGGLQFKPMDDGFFDLIPVALRKPLADAGFSVNLPAVHPIDPLKRIRRIQGGTDIAGRDEVYAEIALPVATGSLEAAVAMFSRGEIRNFDLFGYDFFGGKKAEITVDPAIVADAKQLRENPGEADLARIAATYLEDTPDSRNRLGRLLLAYPADFLPEVSGEKISLMEFFNLYRQNPDNFSNLENLPETIRKALLHVDETIEHEDRQKASLEGMGISTEAQGVHFTVPEQLEQQAGAYRLFLKMSDYIAAQAIRKVKDLVTPEDVGQTFYDRLGELGQNPPVSLFYAETDGLSMAHAYQQTNAYAWNILDAESKVKALADYIHAGPEGQGAFLKEMFEPMIETLTHELTHLLEGSQEGTHDKLFYDRQKFLLSALISLEQEAGATIADFVAELPFKERQSGGFMPVVQLMQGLFPGGAEVVPMTGTPVQGETKGETISAESLGSAAVLPLENPLTVLTGFKNAEDLAKDLEARIARGEITDKLSLKEYLSRTAESKLKEYRKALEDESGQVISRLTAAENFFDALFDLESELGGVAANLSALGIPVTAEELASSLRGAVFDRAGENAVKFSVQAENTVTDEQLRLFDAKMRKGQELLARKSLESGQKFSLALQHAGQDMPRELEALKNYRQMIKLLIILHGKSDALKRSDFSSLGVTTLPVLLDTAAALKVERVIRQTMRQMDSSKVPPLFIFSKKMGLNADLSQLLLSILAQIDQVPERMKKQAIDAVLLVIFSLAMAGEDERDHVLSGSKPAFEKLLADYDVSFLKDAFNIDSGGGMSLSISSFISSIIEAAQEQAVTEKAA